MRATTTVRLMINLLALWISTLPAHAQEGTRDPTVPPGETSATAQSPAGTEGMTVLVRDEKPYLMVGARLYAPGDKVGNLRIERITEKEVWFHDGSALIKVPRFAGIERTSIAVPRRCSAPMLPLPVATINKSRAKRAAVKRGSSSSASEPPSMPAVAPCEDAQP